MKIVVLTYDQKEGITGVSNATHVSHHRKGTTLTFGSQSTVLRYTHHVS